MTGYDESDYRHEPRILLFDIECTPLVAYSWGPKYNVNLIKIIKDWNMLSFAYRWYGTKEKTKVVSLPQFEGYEDDLENDYHVVKALWELFDEADIVIAHNGNKFDIKKIQARFAVHGLGRPSPIKSVDTVQVSRRQFGFASHSLNDLGAFLGLGQKLTHTGFELWEDCMAGDPKAWKLMEKYNVQDVVLLEQVYEKFLMEGWIVNHPNLALLSGENQACPACRSHERTKNGTAITTAYRFQQWKCSNCGSYYRSRMSTPGSRSEYRQT